ncbi:MAG: hypothetical protein CM1200mP8_1670 [Chloroflexota bacterium]|nr:MAG: hypothetical protein CM1200mP8_1670 [Chloroflexota bacterium]
MFFLISIWGTGRKDYSAMKFIIFTFLGSAFMLVGILALYISVGTFDMTALPALVQGGIKLIIPAGLYLDYYSLGSLLSCQFGRCILGSLMHIQMRQLQ